ncbi:N-acetyllactosaminide beta-1,3-N-acetylglucosaminyltransferase 3-like [Bombina bombina]|uniref:N-acetyllactosaminide beta-1,3-N-acetylglucosaminyltransferase 3-like n=1 Tax=Bombina bombina TaxID=8345 RepID=UPI00235B259D|nr:N-acetyllactosaminide beta-1,3-N-acetylglucosaminyltransferase 3-like [Bombina bombina]XP_053558846.1 N-acetyllactosaminide beta-1,3-N-acetylglucosaminyltransferase 3-like [Bombina bombina]
MKRYRVNVEAMVLLFVGLMCLLFLVHDANEPPVLQHEKLSFARPSRLTAESPSLQQLQWISKCQENASVENIDGFSKLPSHVKDFLKYRHCRTFPLILDSPKTCGGSVASKNVFLLLAIKSSPANYERRSIIRQTWGEEGAYNGVQVRRIFLSGIPKNQKDEKRMRQLLTLESQMYGDILQWEFQDTFFNLTLKQVLFHQWLEDNCPGVHFIFNGDDDVFVNTFNVITYLHGLGEGGGNKHLFVGQLIANVGPIREAGSKYYVPVQITTSNSYPMYCGGGGILMSRYTSQAIYNASQSIDLLPIDDVYLGMCLEKAGLVPASHIGMSTVGIRVPSNKLDPFDPCYYRELLMVHRFVPYEMLIMWKAVQDPNLDCGKKSSIYVGV